MIRRVALVSFVVIGLALAGWTGGLSAVGTNVVDVGSIKDYMFTNVIFTVRNSSDTPVNIKRLVPTCSCLKARMGRGDLAPGETAQIALGLSGFQAFPGDFNHGVWIHDESGPSLKLSLTGTIVPLFTGLPASVVGFEALSSGADVFTNHCRIVATDPGVKLGIAQVSAVGLDVTVAVATNAGEYVSYEVETILKVQGGVGRETRRVSVVFPVLGKDAVETKPVELSFVVALGGKLKVMPQRLVMRSNEPRQLVVSSGKRVLQVTPLGWEPRLDGLAVSAQPSRLGGGLVVTVTADATAVKALGEVGALCFSYPGCTTARVVIAVD